MAKKKKDKVVETTKLEEPKITQTYSPITSPQSSLYEKDPVTGEVVKWQSFNLAKFPVVQKTANYLESANDNLEKVQIFLKNAETLTKALLAIIETIEWFLNSIGSFWALFDLLIDMLRELIHSYRSTGIYGLDLVSYHINKYEPINNLIISTSNGAWFNQQIKYTDNDAEELENALASGNYIKATELYAKQYMRSLNIYKEETYYEFIDTICSAFTDVNDIPDPSLYDVLFESATMNDLDTKYPNFRNKVEALTKCGRPEFGDGCQMGVALFAFCFQSPVELAKALYSLCVVLGKTPESVGMPWIRDFKDFPSLSAAKKTFSDEFEKRISDYENRMRNITAEEPNFFGTNLYQLFYPFFNKIDAFLDTLYGKRLNTDADGIFTPVKEFLERLNKWLEFIDAVTQQIQDFITVLEGFLMLSQISMLTFTTNEGTDGVLETLRNATGFYDQDVYNTKLKAMGFDSAAIALISDSNTDAILEKIAEQKLILDNELNDLNFEALTTANEYNTQKDYVDKATYIRTEVAKYLSELSKTNYYVYKKLIDDFTIAANERIASYNASINVFDKTKNYDYFKAIRDENVFNASNDGELVSTLNDEISNIQTQIDALIAQHDDPDAAEIDDYDSQLETLENNRDNLIKQRDDAITGFNKIAMNLSYTMIQFDSWKETASINSSSKLYLIDDRITYLETQLNNKKTDQNNYMITYNNTYDSYYGDNGSITLKEEEISMKENDLSIKESELEYAQRVLAYYVSNPPTTQEEINQRDNCQNIVDTYPAIITGINNQLVTLNNQLSALNDQWTPIEESKDTFITNNNQSQENISNEIYITKYYKNVRPFEIMIELEEISIEEFTEQQNELCQAIVVQLKEQYITFNDQAIYSKTYELANKLYNFSYVPDVPDIERIDTMISDYTKDMEIKKLLHEKKIEEIRLKQERINMFTVSNSEIKALEKIDNWWSPDKKYWYGGFLFCYGFPNETFNKDGLAYKTAMNYTEIARKQFVMSNEETKSRIQGITGDPDNKKSYEYMKNLSDNILNHLKLKKD